MSAAALPVLRTPRLTLRPLRPGDADAVADGVGNYDVVRWLGRVPYPYDRSDAEAFIERVGREARRVWAVEDGGGFVGVAGIEEELGYWIVRPAWGRGYGFEAAHSIVSHWFDDPAAGDLASGHYCENDRSRRILQALGFLRTGESPRFARALSQEVMGADLVLTRGRWEARQAFTLTTRRLCIRPFEERDVDALRAMAVPALARNMSRIPLDWSEPEVLEFIAESAFRGVPGFRLAIERDGVCIGGVGLGGDPVGIAYFLAPDHWGQGLATEALSGFLPMVFDRFPLQRLTADHFEDNPASGAILRKLGFRETGRELGTSKARLEPAPVITYALTREGLKVPA